MSSRVGASTVIDLPYLSTSVAVAREHVSAELTAQGASPRTVEDAALVVSELVGNALRHARPLPGGQVRVSWEPQDRRLELAVTDGGSSTTPVREPLSIASAGGRGLSIVNHLAEAWGVRRHDDVTTVWAIVPAPALVYET